MSAVSEFGAAGAAKSTVDKVGSGSQFADLFMGACARMCRVMNIHCTCVRAPPGIGHRLSQHLHGELAGLMVLNNHTEADHVIQCINSCEQKLDFHAINEMETGMVSTRISSLTLTHSFKTCLMHAVFV